LSGETVAIKKINSAFDNPKHTKRTLRELRLSGHFNHENILGLKDIIPPPSRNNFNDVYIVTELMDTDLHQIIASQQQLSMEHVQYFLYQMLRGVKMVHSANVLHRDLKPSNLLVNSDCLLKICDFGLSRVAAPTTEEGGTGMMTEYVATRWYRAPEVILSWNHYSKAIDMWSIGCIFAELLARRPLFRGGDYIHQVRCILDIIGSPSEEDLASIQNDDARRFVYSLGYKPKVPLRQLFPQVPPDALDLLDRMLIFHPAKRISVEDALAHPYFASLHDPNDEPTCAAFNFDFENYDLSRDVYRDLIWQEILNFHPELRTEFDNTNPNGNIINNSHNHNHNNSNNNNNNNDNMDTDSTW
jgi:serine/threonine protein kinase